MLLMRIPFNYIKRDDLFVQDKNSRAEKYSLKQKNLLLNILERGKKNRSSQSEMKRKKRAQSEEKDVYIVEGPTDDGTYILIDGPSYDHHCRKNKKNTSVWCVVTEESSLEKRIFHRLYKMIMKQQETGYDLTKMIHYLKSKGYTDYEIAKNALLHLPVLIVLTKQMNINSSSLGTEEAQLAEDPYSMDFVEQMVYIPGFIAFPYHRPFTYSYVNNGLA